MSYKIDNIKNISAILTTKGLLNHKGIEITQEHNNQILKSYIKRNPVITSFIVKESFWCKVSNSLIPISLIVNTSITLSSRTLWLYNLTSTSFFPCE